MKDNIVFLSGLPRTGSTLLTSILRQNAQIHTEGNSALCQLMWDTQVSCERTEQIRNRPDIPDRLLHRLPHIFYEGHDEQIVIDKCRSWTMPANLELIDRYITKSPRIIVMLRPIEEIVRSLVFIRKMNGWTDPESGLLDDESEPIMRSLDGISHAKSIDSGQFLFLWYEQLVCNTQETIERIYDFCGWNMYDHTYAEIVNPVIEHDDMMGLVGLHDIRPTISRRDLDVTLSTDIQRKAQLLEDRLR